MTWLLFLVIAVVLLLMRRLISPSKKEDTTIPGTGIIEKRIQENCRINFYVRFRDAAGVEHVGESITYKSTKGKYYEGDRAAIRYYFSPKGRPFVIIDDPELISSEMEAKPVSRIMLVAAIVSLVVSAIAFFAQAIL